jgi:hypothetical protein
LSVAYRNVSAALSLLNKVCNSIYSRYESYEAPAGGQEDLLGIGANLLVSGTRILREGGSSKKKPITLKRTVSRDILGPYWEKLVVSMHLCSM